MREICLVRLDKTRPAVVLTREAARAAMADGRERLGIERVVAIVTPGNERSVRLLAKLGLSQGKRVRLGAGEEECLLLEAPDKETCGV